ncbi:hypothetical protein VC83_02239 [Pseudogymnoascus destructans]|uniref:Uncharacterized protein n=1 Tax=Pseudogymnoascus destructans TaxID=655981 RepID=A0A177AHN0_9PEZI|nr:uncharacterized protein VC83_02239 [Pseudogymnoascus destructans]OAF61568.1 hypothetical protein VC83_02239 [Pseudogymnoascus destructans]
MRGWKYHLQNDILTHVKTAMEADESGLLASCGNMKDLVKTFQRRFTPENFFEVFQFVCHYLSLEESTQLAQLYAIDIYMHFCARAKLMADWEPKPPGTPPALTRKFDKIYGTILTL